MPASIAIAGCRPLKDWNRLRSSPHRRTKQRPWRGRYGRKWPWSGDTRWRSGDRLFRSRTGGRHDDVRIVVITTVIPGIIKPSTVIHAWAPGTDFVRGFAASDK